MAIISIALALASFGVSIYTLWIVHLRRGRLRMTQPTMLFLGRDRGSGIPKLWLRTLLFSTSARGQIVESMFLRVHAPVSGPFMFDFWAYGENNKISRGSGLFVGQTGVVHDNHFMLHLEAAEGFLFWAGTYRVEVFASILSASQPQKLIEVALLVDGQQSAELVQISDAGMFFDWDAEAGSYRGHVERQPTARAL